MAEANDAEPKAQDDGAGGQNLKHDESLKSLLATGEAIAHFLTKYFARKWVAYNDGGTVKKPVQFIVLICVSSWAIAGAAIWLGLSRQNQWVYTMFAAAYMLLPAICAITLQIIHKEKPFRNLNVSFLLNRWFLIAGVAPIIYAFITVGINLLFPNVSFSVTYSAFLSNLPAEQAETAVRLLSKIPPPVFLLIAIAQAFIAGYTINAFLAFGEEFGWRGYLLKALGNRNFLTVSVIVGIVWGLWHFPLILLGHNYPKHPEIGVGMMTIGCVLLSPVITYIVIKSKSVITAAIFHGTLNAISGFCLLYVVGGNDLTNGVTGAAGFAALLLVNIALFLYDRYITKEKIFTTAIEG